MKVGDLVTNKFDECNVSLWSDVSLWSNFSVNPNEYIVDTFKKGEVGVILEIAGSNTQVRILSPRGTVGWTTATMICKFE